MEKIQLRSITKHFAGGVVANEDISLEARAGEVHVILGENGAGKTTLMQILAGLLQPTSGQVEIDGQACRVSTPQEAKRKGIGMVHQHFSLIPSLTVAENLSLSRVNGGFFYNQKKWSHILSQKAEECGLEIRPGAIVDQLSLGERQRVEVFRLIIEGARALILDEPTSILSPHDAGLLFEHIRRFAASGHIIFLVTHKIHHVRAVGQRLSVLRRGRLVRQCSAHDLSDDQLADLMVGTHLEALSTERRSITTDRKSRPVLDIRGLTVPPLACPDGLQDATFTLQPGEVLGVAGISGNGQDELVSALTGSVPCQGSIVRRGNGSLRIGYIPADRRRTGSALSLSVSENLALRSYHKKPFSRGFLMRPREMRQNALALIDSYKIRVKDPDTPAGLLSGGNLQKVVVARELEGNPDVVIAVNPTAGLDVATVMMVHEELLAKAASGTAILCVSEDLDELFQVSDRLIVLRKGKIEDLVRVEDVDKGDVGLLMSRGKSKKDALQCPTGIVDASLVPTSVNASRGGLE
jgi:general nucleoside transport system ATP-binding protein